MEFPSEAVARRAMVEVGRRLYARGLINGGEGNLSCRLGPRRLLCTPSGVNKGFFSEEALGAAGPPGGCPARAAATQQRDVAARRLLRGARGLPGGGARAPAARRRLDARRRRIA